VQFGNRLRKLRKERKLTQEQLGELIDLSESTISLYEGNKRQPDYNTLYKLAKFFRVSSDYLLGYSDIRETPEQRIESAISDDPKLMEFWQELQNREDLQLLFKQVKPMSPKDIKKIINVIKAIEDEESMED